MRTAAASGLGGLVATMGSAVATVPGRLIVALAVIAVVAVALLVGALVAALVSDRAAERAALLIATLRGQHTMPRLPRRAVLPRAGARRADPR